MTLIRLKNFLSVGVSRNVDILVPAGYEDRLADCLHFIGWRHIAIRHITVSIPMRFRLACRGS